MSARVTAEQVIDQIFSDVQQDIFDLEEEVEASEEEDGGGIQPRAG